MSPAFAAPLERQTRAPSREELQTVLSRLLARSRPRARIVGIERTPCAYGSSWWLEDIVVQLDDGSQLALVFKDLGREVSGSAGGAVRPAFVTDPTREPWTYRTVLWQTPGPPKLFVAGSNWLLLERVNSTRLSEVGKRETWCSAARWLGHFHATVPVPHLARSPLLRHDHDYQRGWLMRALSAARKDARTSHPAREKLARLRALAPAHRRAIGDVYALDRSLIHGEFYPSNVLVDESDTSNAVRPVDWEMAALGPPQLDLAALTSGWDWDHRVAMASAYLDGARAAGARCPTLDELMHGVTACRLLLAVQWLGWATGWTAPAGHRNDWLQEAEQCAEELRG